MSADPIERARRLLALASPIDNASEAERALAAQRLVETIREHGLTIAPPQPPPSALPTAPPSGLQPLLAIVRREGLVCASCGGELGLDQVVLVTDDGADCPACWWSELTPNERSTR